ncbi:MAG: monovalent cation:proton antiporter-2 (CPA2) family protein [Gammaproteobacteria bacterium]|nr:monovalent cation:proton antiporter-2 (CPA2) family protein [Gammaproteobacteria bacterium]MBU1655323.1 monovalent cation:proton antiporter-2 (CPA2) family protein [Gammaproteobacteria bacterium]MBU1961468.1 monovalent cation:proton antiporter-2 (CPA2) family protein [Gammaproteobacteria bacterium]
MNTAYLVDIIVMLAAAILAVPLSRFLGLGAVPGFLMAGVIVGPSTLGLIDNMTEIGHLAELGVVLLLFVIGIELKPTRLWMMRRMVFGLGTLQVVITGAVISAIAFFLLGVPARAAILIGPALALSSTAMILQILTEQRSLTSEHGRVSIAVLLFQDIAVVPLMTLVALLSTADMTIEADIGLALLQALAILSLVILSGRYLLKPLLHWVARSGTPEIFTASAVLLVVGTSVLMAKIGLSMAMGAFIAGLLIADSEFRHQVMAEILPFRGLLLGLFFMSMGMSLDLGHLLERPLLSFGLVAGLLLVKGLLLWPLASLFGQGRGAAAAIALLLAQSGEFALVLFASAFQSALLDEALFQQLLVMVLLSMMSTPLLARLAHRLAVAHADVTPEGRAKRKPPRSDQEERTPPILIVGFGRVGRHVAQILEMSQVPYVAVDKNPATVQAERGAGRPVYYGDAHQPQVLKGLEVAEAGLVIITIDDHATAANLVALLHNSFPKLEILARGHDLNHCRQLMALGAQFTVSENLEASIALAEVALVKVRGAHQDNARTVERFRQACFREGRNSGTANLS